MWLIPNRKHRTTPAALHELCTAINAWLAISRFTAFVAAATHSRRGLGVFITTVRLRRAKPYCGQHPGPCLAQNRRRHPVGKWLEGADWVGFNDGLNDLLDRLRYDADCWSYNREAMGNTYYIRRGRLRRCNYASDMLHRFGGVVAFWEKDRSHDFVDHYGRKRPLRSEYTPGTPGIADWRPSAELKYPELFVAHSH